MRIYNPTEDIALHNKVKFTAGYDGEEIIPVSFSDNFITILPHEIVYINFTFDQGLLP